MKNTALVKDDDKHTAYYLVVSQWDESFFMKDKPSAVHLFKTVAGLSWLMESVKRTGGTTTVPPVKKFGTRDAAIKEFKRDYGSSALYEMHTTQPELITLSEKKPETPKKTKFTKLSNAEAMAYVTGNPSLPVAKDTGTSYSNIVSDHGQPNAVLNEEQAAKFGGWFAWVFKADNGAYYVIMNMYADEKTKEEVMRDGGSWDRASSEDNHERWLAFHEFA